MVGPPGGDRRAPDAWTTSRRSGAVWRRPLRAAFRDHELVTNAPPSSGGALIAYMLSVLDGFAAGAGDD